MRIVFLFLVLFTWTLRAQEAEVHRLVGAMLGNTPLVDDLRVLSDEIGGRATGSEANLKSVDWASGKRGRAN